jgi:sortase A
MRRVAGFSLIALSAILFAWVAVTLQYGDPITSLETKHEQEKLEDQLREIEANWKPTPAAPSSLGAAVRRTASAAARPTAAGAAGALWSKSGVPRWAAEYRRTLDPEDPVGRIVVPKLGLRMVVVEGTSKSALKKGPGRYIIRQRYRTMLPGQGGVVAIAGHRTTYGKPFRHLDTMRKGDRVYLEMPYGRFTYRVYKHKIVDAGDWAILGKAGFEKLVLSACHPLHSLKQRWVVFAKLVRTQPPWAA